MLFSLNGLFIILSRVSVWVPLFVLMMLFNLLSPWSRNWTLPLLRYHYLSLFAYCNAFNLIFFFIKAWKYTEETSPKRNRNKIWIYRISCDFWYRCFSLNFAKFLGARFLQNTNCQCLTFFSSFHQIYKQVRRKTVGLNFFHWFWSLLVKFQEYNSSE